jgi:hypothetical protein
MALSRRPAENVRRLGSGGTGGLEFRCRSVWRLPRPIAFRIPCGKSTRVGEATGVADFPCPDWEPRFRHSHLGCCQLTAGSGLVLRESGNAALLLSAVNFVLGLFAFAEFRLAFQQVMVLLLGTGTDPQSPAPYRRRVSEAHAAQCWPVETRVRSAQPTFRDNAQTAAHCPATGRLYQCRSG